MSENRTIDGRPISPIADKLDFVVSEAYNMLRTNLMLSIPETKGGKIIGITSATPQDGKSYTSINLSYALAKDGHKTILVSSDLRKPTLEKILEIKKETGMADILSGYAELEPSIEKGVIHENLSVLPAGTIPPMPSELLGSKRFLELLDELREKYDYIIMDLPPVMAVADPIVVGSKIDGVVVLVRHKISRRKNLYKVINQLRYANVHILGFVYNAYYSGSKYYSKNKYYSSYGYKYYYKSDK